MSNLPALSALNLNHLFYFWVVTREGSITGASRALGLTHPTVSGQVHALERALGQPLLVRRGRTVALTPAGEVVKTYADSIMSLGADLVDVLASHRPGAPLRLAVGVSNAVPKPIARSLLEPALMMEQPIRLVCRDDRPERLMAALAANELDLVLTDAPLPPRSSIRAFNHVLGESDVSFFAHETLASQLQPGFPRSLDGAPVLLPTDDTTLRRALDAWFLAENLRPHVVAEIEDAALLNVFAQRGLGAFAAPSIIEPALFAQVKAVPIGRVLTLRETFYAISAERRLQNPAVIAIREAARTSLFARM